MGLDISFDLHKTTNTGNKEAIASTGWIRNNSYAILNAFVNLQEDENVFSREISAKRFLDYYDAVKQIAKDCKNPDFVTVEVYENEMLNTKQYYFQPNSVLAVRIERLFPGFNQDTIHISTFMDQLAELLFELRGPLFDAEYGEYLQEYRVVIHGWR